MRTLLRLPLPLLVAALAVAEEKETASAPAGKTAITETKSCPLCKLPGRASLFAGTVRPCPADCTKLCCTGTKVVFVLKGVTGTAAARKITGALAGLEGVQITNARHEPGRIALRHAPDKVTRAQLRNIITGSGYQVTGEQATFSLRGLTTAKLAATVETAILTDPGVTGIEAVCNKSGKAIVVFNPTKTSPQKITTAIHTTPCRVVTP